MTDRSSEELERDADRLRSGIASTTDELKHRMSPGQMIDEVTSYLRDSDGSIAVDNLRRQVRDNPMALALIGTGLAWLMFGGRNGGRHDADYGYGVDYAGASYGDVPARPGTHGTTASSTSTGMGTSTGTSGSESSWSERAGGAAGKAGEKASGMAARAGEAGREASQRVAGFAEDASARVRAMGHDASDRVGAYAHDAAERGRHMADASRERLSHGGRSLMDALEREPLVIGGIGLAVGAAIGAMLPGTRTEDEAFGDTRDRLVSGAGRALDRAAHGAERAASDAYDAGRDAAEREGLVPHEGDRPLAERLGNVAKAAAGAAGKDAEEEGRAAGEEARRHAQGGTSGGTGSYGSGSTAAGGTAGAPSATVPPAGSSTGTTAPGSGAGVAGGAASGLRQPPRTGTDDLATRGTEGRKDEDRGPGRG